MQNNNPQASTQNNPMAKAPLRNDFCSTPSNKTCQWVVLSWNRKQINFFFNFQIISKKSSFNFEDHFKDKFFVSKKIGNNELSKSQEIV